MKVTAFLVTLAFSALGGIGKPVDPLRPIDDPPPEPVTCPLCGGDPVLHVVRTFAIMETGVDLAVRVLRW